MEVSWNVGTPKYHHPSRIFPYTSSILRSAPVFFPATPGLVRQDETQRAAAELGKRIAAFPGPKIGRGLGAATESHWEMDGYSKVHSLNHH